MAKNKKPKPASVRTTRRSRRFYVLVALLVFLLCIFLLNGGVAGIARTYAKSALLANDAKRASPWLKIARSIGSETPELHYLLARFRDAVTQSRP